jgi:hypothetical protein
MKKEIHFDVNSIIKIVIHDRKRSSYGWLPERQRTWFFGLIKRNKFQEAGYYPYKCYWEGSMTGDSWEASPSTRERLIEYGYQVEPDGIVWEKPYISISLKGDHSITKKFETFEDAKEYVEDIKEWSDIKFYILTNG